MSDEREPGPDAPGAGDPLWVYQQMKQLRLINRASRALGRHRRVEDAANELMVQLQKLLPGGQQALYLAEGTALRYDRGDEGFPADLPADLSARLTADVFHAVVREEGRDLVFPMVNAGHLVGAVWLRRERPCDEDDVDCAETLMELGSMAIARTRQQLELEQHQHHLLSSQLEENQRVYEKIRQLRQLNEASGAIGRHLRTDGVLSALAEQVPRLAPVLGLAVYLLGEDGQYALASGTPLAGQTLDPAVAAATETFYRRVKSYRLADDVALSFPEPHFLFPYVAGGRLLGVAILRMAGEADQGVTDALETLMGQAALALDNCDKLRQWEDQQQALLSQQLAENRKIYEQIQQLRVLNEASAALGRNLKSDDVLAELQIQLPKLAPISELAIYYRQGEAQFRHVAGQPGLGSQLPPAMAQTAEELYGLAYRIPPQDLGSAGDPANAHGYLVPMATGDNLVGVVFLRLGHAPSDGVLGVLENIHGQAALAILNARLYAQSEQRAITDALTGAYNRRYFNERLIAEMQRSDRYNRPFGLVLIDIDHFKNCNDTLGHLAGDQVLKLVSRVIQQNLRLTDVVARYGGEEFAAILPETDLAGTHVVAERIRAAVAETEFPDMERLPDRRVTISGGVTAFWPGCGVDELISTADSALYQAKQGGRNQVCLFPATATKRSLA